MRYEFRIGDYAETKDGRRGYVIKSDLLCYQDIVTGYIVTVKFSNEETMRYDFTANEAHWQFNRIGRYDFSKKPQSYDLEKKAKPAAISQFTSVESGGMVSDKDGMRWKINELVRAVNWLLETVEKEQA